MRARRAPSNAMNATAYRRLLAGPNGLLAAGKQLFEQQGQAAWCFQQDGATSHTVAQTEAGRATRALIEAQATLIEPWPPHSPDMSPIEKAWSAAEQHLWATEKWHDLHSFKAALHRSWSAVITPAYCKKLFRGLRATYDAVVRVDGAQIAGWGVGARAAE